MKKLCYLFVFALLLSGCTTVSLGGGMTSGIEDKPGSGITSSGIDTSNAFSERDLSGEYDTKKNAHIQLKGTSASCSSNAVQISGNRITITDEGTYILSGTLDDGMIVVNADKGDKVQLVLRNVQIHSENFAALYVLQADKVFVTLEEGSNNQLSNGGSFTALDNNDVDGVIFSKEDVTFNGTGALMISSPAGHGIVSKDELTVTGGTYEITCASHGLVGKDSVCVAGGDFTLSAGKDGIHAENNDDASLGFVYLKDGAFKITAEGDGISAASHLQIDGGTFDILAGGGSKNGDKHTSDSWGGFPGGMGGYPGRPGGRSTTAVTGDDSTSIKGLKAGGNLLILSGSFVMDTADDGVHSNGNLTVNGGTFQIATGDDGFHADETLAIAGGVVQISESYEGLEGLHVVVSGGEITLTATDDGINAAGGIDQSGMGGNRPNERFGGMGGNSNGSITISGGKLYIKASGDGVDANGTLTITGGHTVVCGPTTGDTATLDFDKSGVISGGTFIGTGASGMAQTFSASEQGVIAVNVGTRQAGTKITLSDTSGNVLLSAEPELSYAVVILSCPQMVKGQTYKITVGTDSGEFEAK